jgi:hypothetical protein
MLIMPISCEAELSALKCGRRCKVGSQFVGSSVGLVSNALHHGSRIVDVCYYAVECVSADIQLILDVLKQVIESASPPKIRPRVIFHYGRYDLQDTPVGRVNAMQWSTTTPEA